MTPKKIFNLEPKHKVLFPIPLFEKLIDDNLEASNEIPCFRFYELEEVIQSIQNNIYDLISTRNGMKRQHYVQMIQDPDNWGYPALYGVPDYQEIDPSDRANWTYIEDIYEKAIALYESRLTKVAVKVVEFEASTQRLGITIQGLFVSKDHQQEVTFPLSFNF